MRKLQLSMAMGMLFCMILWMGGCTGNTETGLQQGNPKTQSTSNFNWREEQWKCSSQLSEPEMLEVDGYMLFSYDGIGVAPLSA